MKLTKRPIAFLFAILGTALICLPGCSSTGMERSKEASTTMQTMDNDIKSVMSHLDVVGLSLEEMIKADQQEVKKAFDTYTENVSKMESLEKQFVKHADEMKSRGIEYFEEWQKDGNEYKNPRIQKLSEQRRNELGEIYGRIAENSIGVKEAFRAYVSDIKEIQIYLSNDLTSKGIEAIAPISRKVVRDGDQFSNSIKYLQTAIDRAREEMSQSGM